MFCQTTENNHVNRSVIIERKFHDLFVIPRHSLSSSQKEKENNIKKIIMVIIQFIQFVSNQYNIYEVD